MLLFSIIKMLIIFLFSIFLSMLYFVSTLYYIQVLLISLISILCLIVYYNLVSILFAILLSLVYIGAIIIFIGYICAISPNPIFNFNGSGSLFFLIVLFRSILLINTIPFKFNYSLINMFDFFYTRAGVNLFFIVIFFLLVLLILVSSQNFIPKGPFRSI